MNKVMVFTAEDGKQLVKDFEQIIAHIQPHELDQEDLDMLNRVEKVEPTEVVMLTPSQAKHIKYLLELMSSEFLDDSGEIKEAIEMLEAGLV